MEENSITRENMKNELIFGGFFILSAIIIIVLMWPCMPGGAWQDGTTQHTIARYFWYSCSAITFYIAYTAGALKTNIIGLIGSILLGPVALLTIVFYYIYLKLKNRK